MTEAEWLEGRHPTVGRSPTMMLAVVRGHASARKSRLFACACWRRVLHLIPNSCPALDVAELMAEGTVDYSEVRRARRIIGDDERLSGSVIWAFHPDAFVAAERTPGYAAGIREWATESALRQQVFRDELAAQTDLLRDIFGNPFRPVSLNSGWLTSDVLALARGIYSERAFDRMPILADALQDAGCENPDILSHCRDTSLTHVRGCWVVDLLLGKE